jgi:hypothetical protein
VLLEKDQPLQTQGYFVLDSRRELGLE